MKQFEEFLNCEISKIELQKQTQNFSLKISKQGARSRWL